MPESRNKSLWSRTLRWVVTLSMVVSASAANAEGLYQVFAVYESGGKADPIHVSLSKGMLIPDGGEDYNLKRIIARFEGDNVTKSILKTTYKTFAFPVKVNNVPKDSPDIEVEDIYKQTNREFTIYEWDQKVEGPVVALEVGMKLTPIAAGANALMTTSEPAFYVLKAVGDQLSMDEIGAKIEPLAGSIDTDSQVILKLNSAVCQKLTPGELMRAPWSYLLTSFTKDGQQTELKVTPEFRNNCQWRIPVKWKELVDRKVTFKAHYQNPNSAPITVGIAEFDVYNLGLITTLPVFSEIVSAADGTPFRDVEAISKVSINLAVPVGGDRDDRSQRLAIVFPWTLSVNTKRFPNLADYVALAPSVSILGGGSKGDERTSIGLGIGVNLARAFHFSYTVSTTGEKGGYLLMGVSVPELLPLLRKAWGGPL